MDRTFPWRRGAFTARSGRRPQRPPVFVRLWLWLFRRELRPCPPIAAQPAGPIFWRKRGSPARHEIDARIFTLVLHPGASLVAHDRLERYWLKHYEQMHDRLKKNCQSRDRSGMWLLRALHPRPVHTDKTLRDGPQIRRIGIRSSYRHRRRSLSRVSKRQHPRRLDVLDNRCCQSSSSGGL
jgi:hypothetical protein